MSKTKRAWIIPSGQMGSPHTDQLPEAAFYAGLKKGLEKKKYTVEICEFAPRRDPHQAASPEEKRSRSEIIENVLAELSAATPRDTILIYAASLGAELLIELLKLERNFKSAAQLHLFLGGYFPYGDTTLVGSVKSCTLLYGEHDTIAFVPRNFSAEQVQIQRPQDYALKNCLALKNQNFARARLQIIERTNHLLIPTYRHDAMTLKLEGAKMSLRCLDLLQASQKQYDKGSFDALAQRFASSPVHREIKIPTVVQSTLAERTVVKLCDVGCGAGHFAAHLSPANSEVTLVDPSAQMLKVARTQFKNKSKEVISLRASAEALPLASESFDLVISRFSAHHFLNLVQSLQEMKRILKKDGRLVICDLEAPEELPLNEINHQLEVLHDPHHKRSYRKSEWHQILAAAGLGIRAEASQLESPQGLPLPQWFRLTNTESSVAQYTEDFLATLSPEELQSLGLSQSSSPRQFLQHVKSLYIVAEKKGDTHHAVA